MVKELRKEKGTLMKCLQTRFPLWKFNSKETLETLASKTCFLPWKLSWLISSKLQWNTPFITHQLVGWGTRIVSPKKKIEFHHIGENEDSYKKANGPWNFHYWLTLTFQHPLTSSTQIFTKPMTHSQHFNNPNYLLGKCPLPNH